MSNSRGKAAIAILGVVGLFALMAAGSDKAHAKRAVPPPDDDDVEPPAPSVPMPPPPTPTGSDSVVVESPGAEPAEVPIGDALIEDITYEEPDADPLVQQVPEAQDDDGTWTLEGPWIARFVVLPQTGVTLQQLAAAVDALPDTDQIQIVNGAVSFVASDEETVTLEQGQPFAGLPGVLVSVERLAAAPQPAPSLPPPPMPTGSDSVVVESPGAEPAEVPMPSDDEDDEEPPEEVHPVEEDDEDDQDVVAPPAQPAPAPSFPEPDMNEAQAPTVLKGDTAALLKIMLTDELRPNWKRKVPELIAWQAARGLVADGEFGPKSATKMSEETGLLPIVRFWPKGAFPEGKWLPDYQHALRVAAVTAPEPMASQLVAAALRETGQGFGRGQQAISPTIQI